MLQRIKIHVLESQIIDGFKKNCILYNQMILSTDYFFIAPFMLKFILKDWPLDATRIFVQWTKINNNGYRLQRRSSLNITRRCGTF